MIVALTCRDCGRHQVKALFFAGGLAITPYHGLECTDSDQLCRVTHIDSGLALGAPVSFERAKLGLMRLLEVTDWRRPSIEKEAKGADSAWILCARRIIRDVLNND